MILVIGASSSLGRAVVPLLRSKNVPLRISSRHPDTLQTFAGPGVEIVQADLLDRDSLVRACADAEKVFAATHSVMGHGSTSSDHVDLEGGCTLIDVAKEAGVQHFVYTSALGVSLDADTHFYRNKAKVEQHLLESGLPYTILRPAAFFVPHTVLHSKAFTEPSLALQEFLHGHSATFYGHGENPRNFVAVEDVARYAALALTDPCAMNQIIEIGGPENLTVKEVAAAYGRALGHSMELHPQSLVMPRIMHVLMGPFNAGMQDVMQIVIDNDSIPSPFDAAPNAQRYGVTPTYLEQWVAGQIAVPH
ncbi:MAG: NmrA family NAD(P)-binding protein [Anaerolineae bacterium]